MDKRQDQAMMLCSAKRFWRFIIYERVNFIVWILIGFRKIVVKFIRGSFEIFSELNVYGEKIWKNFIFFEWLYIMKDMGWRVKIIFQ